METDPSFDVNCCLTSFVGLTYAFSAHANFRWKLKASAITLSIIVIVAMFFTLFSLLLDVDWFALSRTERLQKILIFDG